MYLHVYFLDTLLQKSQFKKTWEAEIIHYTELLGMHYFLNKNCSSLVNHPYFPQGATDIQLTRSGMHILI